MGGHGDGPAVASGGRPAPRAGECSGTGNRGQAAIGMQMLIWACAVSAGTRGPPGGKPGRALVVRSRWRLRSTSTRRRARAPRTGSWPGRWCGAWSLLKRSMANFAAADLDGLVRIVKRKLKKIQYRPHLIDGCLAATGLTLEPW